MTNILNRIISLIVSAFLLSACGSVYEGDLGSAACPKAEGVPCTSLRDIHLMVESKKLRGVKRGFREGPSCGCGECEAKKPSSLEEMWLDTSFWGV